MPTSNVTVTNLRRGICLHILFVLLLASAACTPASKPSEETSAIKDAILSYVTNVKHVAADQMNATVENITLEGDKATCTATFVSKSGAVPPLSYQYELKKIDGKWQVESSKPLSRHPGED